MVKLSGIGVAAAFFTAMQLAALPAAAEVIRGLWYSDINSGELFRVREGTTTPELITTLENETFVRDFYIDGPRNRVYWLDTGRGEVKSRSLSGGDTTIHSTGFLQRPTALEVDYDNGVMYVSNIDDDNAGANHGIFRMDLDGSNPVNLLAVRGNVTDSALSPDGSTLYVADDQIDQIRIINTDGSGDRAIKPPGSQRVLGVALDEPTDSLFVGEWTSNSGNPQSTATHRYHLLDELWIDENNYGNDDNFRIFSLAVDSLNQDLFYQTNRGQIRRTNFDGSGNDLVLDTGIDGFLQDLRFAAQNTAFVEAVPLPPVLAFFALGAVLVMRRG